MAPAPASETVKRAPKMEEEEAILPSPMKRQKVDDEENDGGNSSESDSSDEDMPVPKPETESDPEPEWDVDSYDGRECLSDPGDRPYFENDDDYKEYRKWRIQTFNCRGFVEDRFRRIYSIGVTGQPFGSIVPTLVSMCVDKLNKEKGKTVECISIERVNICGGADTKFYITFMAREYPNGPPVEYQAKAKIYCRNRNPPIPILCRPAPQPTLYKI